MAKKNWKAGLLVGAALVCFGGSLTAVNAKITITSDSYGVPHIKAGSNQEMFFGFGYAMARDRLIQITKLKIFSSHKFPLDTVQAKDEARFLNLTLDGIEYLRSQYPRMEENIEDAYQDLLRTSISSVRRSGPMGRVDTLLRHLRPSVSSDDGESTKFSRIEPYPTN